MNVWNYCNIYFLVDGRMEGKLIYHALCARFLETVPPLTSKILQCFIKSLRNIVMCDYQESVTIGQTDRHTDGQTVRRRAK